MSAAAPVSVDDLIGQGVGALQSSPNPQTNPNLLPSQLPVQFTSPGGPFAQQVAQSLTGLGLGGAPGQEVNGPPVQQVDTSPMFQLLPSQVLPTQMTFPARYSGPMADAQYMADEAALRYGTAKQYSDLLNQLGFVDPTTGATIQGTIAQGANIKSAQLQNDLTQEGIANDRAMQNAGTIFSGVRGTELARLQYPTLGQLGGLQMDTAEQMNAAYRNAQDLVNQYALQNNQLIGGAAQRYLNAMLQAQMFATGARGGGAGGGGPIYTAPSGDQFYAPNAAGLARAAAGSAPLYSYAGIGGTSTLTGESPTAGRQFSTTTPASSGYEALGYDPSQNITFVPTLEQPGNEGDRGSLMGPA
jgi:hypothetical protein